MPKQAENLGHKNILLVTLEAIFSNTQLTSLLTPLDSSLQHISKYCMVETIQDTFEHSFLHPEPNTKVKLLNNNYDKLQSKEVIQHKKLIY